VTVLEKLNVQKNPNRKPRRLRGGAGEVGVVPDGGGGVNFIPTATTRHAELVSASIFRQQLSVCVARWTLKQVQGDGFGEVKCSKKS
jgi:hypothetical protein